MHRSGIRSDQHETNTGRTGLVPQAGWRGRDRLPVSRCMHWDGLGTKRETRAECMPATQPQAPLSTRTLRLAVLPSSNREASVPCMCAWELTLESLLLGFVVLLPLPHLLLVRVTLVISRHLRTNVSSPFSTRS